MSLIAAKTRYPLLVSSGQTGDFVYWTSYSGHEKPPSIVALPDIFPLSNPSRQLESPHQSKVDWMELKGSYYLPQAVPFNQFNMRGKNLLLLRNATIAIIFSGILVWQSLLLKLAWSVDEMVNGNQREL